MNHCWIRNFSHYSDLISMKYDSQIWHWFNRQMNIFTCLYSKHFLAFRNVVLMQITLISCYIRVNMFLLENLKSNMAIKWLKLKTLSSKKDWDVFTTWKWKTIQMGLCRSNPERDSASFGCRVVNYFTTKPMPANVAFLGKLPNG